MLSGTVVAFPQAVDAFETTQKCPLGTRAYDNTGNEFIYVDFQESFVAGEWAVVDDSYAATQVTSTSRGRCGIVMSTPTTSDTFGWMQVYGVNTAAAGTSEITSASVLVVFATTDDGHVSAQTSSAANVVLGALARSAVSTATSPFTAAGPFTVSLNYPYLTGVASDFPPFTS